MSPSLQSPFHPTLYTPATMPPDKILAGLYTRSHANWRQVLCTEDSIREDDLNAALDNIQTLLPRLRPRSRRTVFVRIRNAETLSRILAMPRADAISGFVVPKADPVTYAMYADQVADTKFRLMPILESRGMFDRHFREDLRAVLADERCRDQIDCLRIGANDLMGYLSIRRPTTDFTVYDTPVRTVIDAIVAEFRGLSGFTITAPVFECFDAAYDDLLRREVRLNINYGLFGQTVISPRHLRIIRDLYKVSRADFESATSVLGNEHAVVGRDGRMDEYTTHHQWAGTIVRRHALFGCSNPSRLALVA